MYESLISLMAAGAGGSGGGRVADFIAATGISDGTIEGALEDLDADFETAGLWPKLIAFYPSVGGDATKHSFNLVDPNLFQITWVGSVTHNANGFTPDGSTGWGDTGIDPSSDLVVNDTSLGFYCRTAAPNNTYQIGCLTNSGTVLRFELGVNAFNANWVYASSYRDPDTRIQGAIPTGDARGFFAQSRVSNVDFRAFKNGSQILSTNTDTQADALTTLTDTIFVGGTSRTGVGQSSNANLSCPFVGSGLTAAEVADMYTAIQAFETTLGRNV